MMITMNHRKNRYTNKSEDGYKEKDKNGVKERERERERDSKFQKRE